MEYWNTRNKLFVCWIIFLKTHTKLHWKRTGALYYRKNSLNRMSFNKFYYLLSALLVFLQRSFICLPDSLLLILFILNVLIHCMSVFIPRHLFLIRKQTDAGDFQKNITIHPILQSTIPYSMWTWRLADNSPDGILPLGILLRIQFCSFMISMKVKSITSITSNNFMIVDLMCVMDLRAHGNSDGNRVFAGWAGNRRHETGNGYIAFKSQKHITSSWWEKV